MRKFYPLIAAAAVAACAAGALAQMPSAAPAMGGEAAAPSALSEAGSDFLKDAAQAVQGQLQAAQVALARTASPAVKTFAQQMMGDYTRIGAQLQQLAQARGVALPAELSVMDTGMLRLLKTSGSAELDARYLDTFGVQAHRQSVEQFRQALQSPLDADVGLFALQALPTLELHLQSAQQVQASVAGTSLTAAAADGSAPDGAESAQAQEERAELVEAVFIVQRMKSDPGVTALLQQAKGVFILRDYGRATLDAGVPSGHGVLLTRQDNGFSNPVFYRLGRISVDAKARPRGGALALLLMTDKAVRDFTSGQTFSLNAQMNISIVNYPRSTQASAGKVPADVIVWSGTKGAYAAHAIGLSDVAFDAEANRAYYGQDGLNSQHILDGSVPPPGHNVLGMVLDI